MYATSRSTSTSTTIPGSATSQGLHPSATRDDSTAFRYLTAVSSMSYVEFHRVRTSLGSSLSGMRNSRSVAFHSGSKSVLELITLKANLRIYHIKVSTHTWRTLR